MTLAERRRLTVTAAWLSLLAATRAQEVAPRNGSAFIQATAQEGRAWARLGAAPQTRDALTRVKRLVEPLPMPDRPEHHFRCDPARATPTPPPRSHGWGTPATSGRLVPSNYWRAAEVMTTVDAHGVPEAAELNEAYRELCAPAENGSEDFATR